MTPLRQLSDLSQGIEMASSQRYRSRLFPERLRLYAERDTVDARPVNRQTHERLHPQERYIYTSPSALSTTASAPIHVTHGGYITGVRLSVAGTPGSTLTCDVLLNGNSIFPSSSKPTIASGDLYGALAISDVVAFNVDDKMQVQLTATGSATGPLVAQIEYLRAL